MRQRDFSWTALLLVLCLAGCVRETGAGAPADDDSGARRADGASGERPADASTGGDAGDLPADADPGEGGDAEGSGDAGVLDAEPDQASPDTGAPSPCDGQPDGLLVEAGDPTECRFAQPCDAAGTRTRAVTICRAGLAVPELETAPCERDPEGILVIPADFGACDYPTECAEEGTRSRTQAFCRAGQPTLEQESEPCARETEGLRVSEGELGPCAFADDCAQLGQRQRLVGLCQAGEVVSTPEHFECARDTEGLRLAEGAFGECQFADRCVETGQREREARVCRAGIEQTEVERDPCTRDTGGIALAPPVDGDCVFPTQCAADGTRSRSTLTCVSGVAQAVEQALACAREIEGVVAIAGTFGDCTYPGPCADAGEMARTQGVCRNGAIALEVETAACARTAEGTLVAEGTFGICVTASTCVEVGTERRTNSVCRSGAPVLEQESRACTRDTDGLQCRIGATCVEGICVCPPPLDDVCGNRCVDQSYDEQNCGACGRVCAEGEACVSGICSRRCGNGVVEADADETCDDGNEDPTDGCIACQESDVAWCTHGCSQAGTWPQFVTEVRAPPVSDAPADSQRFGSAVGVSQQVALVGVNDGFKVFERNAQGIWNLRQTLASPRLPGRGEGFGRSLRMLTTYGVAGLAAAVENGITSGAAYYLNRSNQGVWSVGAKLVPPDGADQDFFGEAVTILNGDAIVGASRHDARGENSGAVYVFRTVAVGQVSMVQKITAPDAVAHASFGNALAAHSNVLAVAALRQPGGGAVYLYTRDGAGNYVFRQKLTPTAGGGFSAFGQSVATRDGEVMVGDYQADDSRGRVYFFGSTGPGTWEQTGLIAPPALPPNRFFGRQVAFEGDLALVTASQTGGALPADRPGVVFHFSRDANDEWVNRGPLPRDDAEHMDRFGFDAIALSGNEVIVTASELNGDGSRRGRAYRYAMDFRPTCHRDGDCFCFGAADGEYCSGRPLCGDRVVQPPETCDDGNRRSRDGCTADCTLEP